MIKQQLRTGAVVSENILDLYHQINREDFVPEAYRAFAFSDMQIPLGFGERMMTPLEEGKLLQALDLQGHETILEVGTGSGFLTALLSRLGKHVTSVERQPAFLEKARKHLSAYGIDNVDLVEADGINGYFDKAPYDVIVMTGAIESITDGLRLQLLTSGKLFAITGTAPALVANLHFQDENGEWVKKFLYNTDLPYLLTKHQPKAFTF